MAPNRAFQNLVDAWRRCSQNKIRPKSLPYILDGDESMEDKDVSKIYSSFEEFIQNYDQVVNEKKLFHLGLLPVPYSGDILNAKIYLLNLNPSFGPGDYYEETHIEELRQERIRVIEQRNLDHDYPWIAMNPKFCWTGEGKYWVNHLRDIANKLSKDRKIRFTKVLKKLSKNIACLEYIPYHSKYFGLPQKIKKGLCSPGLMIHFINEYVIPKVEKEDAAIIVMRHKKEWGFLDLHNKNKNIVIYDKKQARSGYLTEKSPGGKKILELLG